MATKTKQTTIGNYITKVNNYDIRMSLTFKPVIRGQRYKKEVLSHEFLLCRGRKIITTGLKTKVEAMVKANSM